MFLRNVSLWCIFVLFAKGCVCQGLPVNVASLTPAPESIYLICPMDENNDKWFFKDNTTWIQFAENCAVFPDYTYVFEIVPAVCFFLIPKTSITLDLWTQYACTPYAMTDTKHSVQLIVTERVACPASPVMVLAGEAFLVNCSAEFSGLWAPQLTWTDSQNNIITTTNETTSQTAIYWAEYTAAPDDTGLSLTCSLSIPPPPPGSIPDNDVNTIHDRGTPDLTDTCETTMHVLYGPQNTTITGPGALAAVNESYVCASDGDPEPQYEWILVEGGGPEHVMGDTLTVQESMTGQSNHYTCRAYNTPREQLVLNDTADIVFTVGFDETTTEEMEITTKENTTPTDDNGSSETTLGETTPGEITPGETTPGEITPGETTPGKTTPGETTPGETTPGETAPGETLPGETSPGETTPGETTQEVSTLEDTTMEETTQKETTQEETTSAKETTTSLEETTVVEEGTTGVERETPTTTSGESSPTVGETMTSTTAVEEGTTSDVQETTAIWITTDSTIPQTITTGLGGPSTSTDSSVDSTSARSIASSTTSVTGPSASTATQPVTDPPGDGDDIPIYAIVVPVVIVVMATATVATVWLLRRANCCAAQGSITL